MLTGGWPPGLCQKGQGMPSLQPTFGVWGALETCQAISSSGADSETRGSPQHLDLHIHFNQQAFLVPCTFTAVQGSCCRQIQLHTGTAHQSSSPAL